MKNNLDIMLGDSLPYPGNAEIDDEEYEYKGELALDTWAKREVLDAIGTNDFKTIYMYHKNYIMASAPREIRTLALEIVEKIEEEYEYRFPIKPESVELEPYRVLEFLEFLEYDNVDFFSKLWYILNINVYKDDYKKFLKMKPYTVMREIEDLITWNEYNDYIVMFLKAYDKDHMVEFIINNTEKSKIDIALDIEQRRVDDE